MVRMVGLEPTRLSSQGPKPCVSTISPHPLIDYSSTTNSKPLYYILSHYYDKTIDIFLSYINLHYSNKQFFN